MEGVPYRRRRPEESVLYRIVQDNLNTFLALAESGGRGGLPAHVVREFFGYLDCGILAKGFVRGRCPDCGHNRLVAFS